MNNSISPELAQKLQTVLDYTVENTGIAGATVAVISQTGTWYSASGVSNLETQTPLNPDNLFQLASVSKSFTGATVLRLVEEEQLSLEDTLDKWLPDSITNNIPNAEDINIQQLLNHTSGIYDYGLNPQWLPDQLANGKDFDLSREEILNNYVAGEDALFAPGESFEYSNTNYLLLGMIIEAATGNSYQSEVSRLILEPLGLENTYFAGDETLGDRLARGYGDRVGEDGSFGADGILEDATETSLTPTSALGDSGIISNAEDVARFSDALFSGELLEPESLSNMLSWSNFNQNQGERQIESSVGYEYGSGVYQEQTPWGEVWGHGGGLYGYRAEMRYFPESDTSVVVLVNQRDAQEIRFSPDSVFSGITRTLLGETENDITLEALLDSFDSNFIDGLIGAMDGVNDEADLFNFLNNRDDNVVIDLEKVSQLLTSSENQNNLTSLLSFLHFGGIAPEESGLMVGNEADNTLTGEEGNDTLAGGLGDDLIFGQAGDDILRGDLNDRSPGGNVGGDDRIYAGAGNDRIGGKAGNDLIFGQAGNDQIWGDAGNDRISGGLGNDTLNGGIGNDVFVVTQNEGTDTIFDFQVDEDLIDITGLGVDFADIDITQQGKDALIAFNGSDIAILQDVNVDGLSAENFINVDSLSADNFIGDDIISGGAGADEFWIPIDDAGKAIANFNTDEDVIGIPGLGASFEDISITQQDDNALIAINGVDLAVLQGINASNLSVDNFAFA